MADRYTHTRFGQVVGAGTALSRAHALPGRAVVAETIGGGFGGGIAGRLPDVVEPPISPRHRGAAHSVAATLALVTAANRLVEPAQAYCRRQAVEWQVRAAAATDGVARFLAQLLSFLWHAAAGFFAGLQGGYVSHLLLDAQTPAGLPVI